MNGKYRPAFLAVLTLAALFGTICGILALLGVFARPATPAVSVFAAGERLSGFRFELIPPRGCRLEAGVPVVTEEALLQEIRQVYRVWDGRREAGLLTLVLQRVAEGGTLYFIAYRSAAGFCHPVSVRLFVPGGPPVAARTIRYPSPGTFDTHRSTWRAVAIASFPCVLPRDAVFIDGPGYALRLGLVDVFRDLGHGVICEEYGRSPAVTVRAVRGGSLYDLPLPGVGGAEVRTWGVLADGPLVDWEDPNQVAVVRVADLNRGRKFWLDGVYDPVPQSYVPSHPRGFWRCPAQHVGEVFQRTPGCYTRTVAVSSMYAAIRAQNGAGYWPTAPKSTWLAGEYGIGHNFYDSRFSTDGAVFLLRAYKALGEEKALAAAARYAAFLCSFARRHAHRTPGGGYLVPDYMDASGRAGTHTSLNHLLAEMNFLYEFYRVTGQKDCRRVADLLLRGIKETRRGWIKPDGDLWYCRLPDGRFALRDYPTLTLRDLRQAQVLLAAINGAADPDLALLIAQKERYNRRHGISLW